MDFKNIPSKFYPAFTWSWNNAITHKGIDKQIDEMYENGIRAFYVLAEPDNWFPNGRATHLSPKYLSDEYLDLLFYTFQKAKEKGMYTWLYNEGAYPSGCACGLVTEKYPELVYKYISVKKFTLQNGEIYMPCDHSLAAFIGEKRIFEGYLLTSDAEISEYFWNHSGDHRLSLRVDNAERRGSEEFINVTHERLKKVFGDYMGTEVQYMFDDESYMGGWTKDFDKIFLQKYGYDILDYTPFISGTKSPAMDKEYRAVSDYMMLCGDLVRDNYFILMRDWLHSTNMLSVGHLDNDDKVNCAYMMHYGNVLKTMRTFDIPGIDVIWEQISYPKNGSCCRDSMEMFPRLASSAARQIGRNIALSESFAVYGAHVTPDLMRFVINYQAVRGINLFNFMVMSNDRKTPMRHQFRPNFLSDNVGMDCLSQINDYTARLSYLLQQGKADIKTALYYPLRTICAGGEKGKLAGDHFVALGRMLESNGVSFDFIDEEFVLNAEIKNGVLVGEFAEYENVFVANGDLEFAEIINKLSLLKAEINPDLIHSNPSLKTRKILFNDGSEGYFIYNEGNDLLEETIDIQSTYNIYEINLFNGDIYEIPYIIKNNNINISISLLRGEGIFLKLTKEKLVAIKKPVYEKVCEIAKVKSYISRIYKLDFDKGVQNIYLEPDRVDGLVEWDESLSGEATYEFEIPELPKGDYRLNLGDVRHYAKVYIDGEKIAESTLYPYIIDLKDIKGREKIKIVVANTPANECARSDYFKKHAPRDVGPYHERMAISERQEPSGGLFGPIIIEVKK